MDRRLSAIVAADVKDYGRLVDTDEIGTLERFSELRRDIIGPLIADYQGRIVKVMGDGFLVEFASAVQAGTCALEWQMRVAEHEARYPPDRRVQFRIGLHVGEVVVDAGDIHGHGVNVAARLEALATPGGILLSEDAWRQISGAVGARFDEAGEKVLKNVAQPVRLYRWEPQRADTLRLAPPPSPAPMQVKPSVAIMPFANLSRDVDVGLLADGLTEDIATELARFVDFETVSLGAHSLQAGRCVDARSLGRNHGVRYLVAGSVQRRGETVRISVKLVDCENGKSLWAERYDLPRARFAAEQDEVTQTITGVLGARISHEAIVETITRRRNEESAYQLTLRAYAAQRRFDRRSAPGARALAEQARALAPDYPPAIRAMAWMNLVEATCMFRHDIKHAFETAYTLAREAVSLDPGAPGSHITLAMMQVAVGLYDRGIASVRKAVAMNPNSADGYVYLGNVLVLSGDLDEAIEAFDVGSRLNAASSSWYEFFHGRALYLRGDLPKAEEMLTDALTATPAYPIPRAMLAATFVEAGRIDEARREIAELVAANPDYRLGRFPESMPLKDRADLDKIVEALRAAGLPE